MLLLQFKEYVIAIFSHLDFLSRQPGVSELTGALWFYALRLVVCCEESVPHVRVLLNYYHLVYFHPKINDISHVLSEHSRADKRT